MAAPVLTLIIRQTHTNIKTLWQTIALRHSASPYYVRQILAYTPFVGMILVPQDRQQSRIQSALVLTGVIWMIGAGLAPPI